MRRATLQSHLPNLLASTTKHAAELHRQREKLFKATAAAAVAAAPARVAAAALAAQAGAGAAAAMPGGVQVPPSMCTRPSTAQ